MPITHFLKRSLITLPATMKAVVSIFIAALLASPCEASAPLFSAEACGTMYEKLVSLGGTVPPNDYVVGCDDVCVKVKEMKDYWKTGEHADHACAVGTVPPNDYVVGCDDVCVKV